MSLTDPRRLARLVGWALLALVTYVAVSAFVFAASWIMLRDGTTPAFSWITAVQEHIYFAGARRIWPAQATCVEFDEELIYRPRLGTCHFDNPEFQTTQTFTSEGRSTGTKPAGEGIVVVGDSHAMGWGVNDDETFAAELQRLTRRPVYNLAVSSYGTEREMVRLRRSGLLARADTVILQYCDNDLEENRAFRIVSVEETRRKYESIGQTAEGRARFFGSLDYVSAGFWFTVRAPISLIKSALVARPLPSFQPHYQPFIDALRTVPELAQKRVMVIYSNSHGSRFADFPVGRDRQLPFVEFLDLTLDRADYYQVDDHLLPSGHRKIAAQLSHALAAAPAPDVTASR